MSSTDRWYFAYGSNLSRQRMEKRTGPVHAARVARLKDFRLAFNVTDAAGVERYANIVPTARGEVWGVVYRMSAEALVALDRYEEVAEGCYSREIVEVDTLDGEQLQAEVYIGGPKRTIAEGRPSERYLKIVLAGANEHKLPVEYIRHIESLARNA
jgi:gamma-glutamylcyclotransferase